MRYRGGIQLQKFWANNCSDLQLRLRPIIARHAAQESDLDFISKLEGAQQELDESDLWLELLSDSGVIKSRLIEPLRQETDELIAIFVTMTKNVKRRR